MNKMGLNRFDYKTDYIKFLAVALSSDAVVMDQGLKEMFEKQIIDMFREPDMYADLFMFKKFWPECIAKSLTKLYANSEKSNEV